MFVDCVSMCLIHGYMSHYILSDYHILNHVQSTYSYTHAHLNRFVLDSAVCLLFLSLSLSIPLSQWMHHIDDVKMEWKRDRQQARKYLHVVKFNSSSSSSSTFLIRPISFASHRSVLCIIVCNFPFSILNLTVLVMLPLEGQKETNKYERK